MSKFFYLFLLFVVTSLPLSVMSQSFRWSQGASSQEIRFYRNATDKHGNCYSTGYFSGTATIGSASVSSAGSQDMFVAKYDSTGGLLWVITAGGAGVDQGYSVAVDTGGNCYVSGTFTGTVQFGNKSVSAVGASDAFVAKYSAAGVILWVNRIGSNTHEYAYGIDVDRQGNAYLTGYFTGFCAFGTQGGSNFYLTAGSNYDVFICKYDKNGVIKWARAGTGGNYQYGYDITADDSGNCYVVGWYNGNITFGSLSLYTNGTFYAGFIVKYNTNGVAQWALNCPETNNYGYCYAIAGDGDGNVYVTGYYYGTAKFGTITITSPTGYYEAFVAKLNTNGVFQWAKPLSTGSSWTWAYDIAADASGNCFITGITYSSVSGNHSLCSMPFPSTNTGGWGYHGFGIKFNTSGTCQWAVRATSHSGGFGWAYGQGISVNDVGGINISGYNTANLKFYVGTDTIGQGTISSAGSFLSRFQDTEFLVIGNIPKQKYCPGDSLMVPYNAYGTFSTTGTFSVQLSDANGSFLNAGYIGSKYTQGSDSIRVYIPANLPNGNGYRIRVESSSPMVRSNKNRYDLEIIRPNSIAGNDTTLCMGDTLRLKGSRSMAQAYLWKSNYVITDSTVADLLITPGSTKQYVLKTNNTLGCVNYDTAVVTVVNRPVPDAGLNDSVCIGDSAQLTATGGSIYHWSPGTGLSDSTIANPKVHITATTTYRVVVSNGVCEEHDSMVLTLRSPISLNSISNKNICLGQSVSLIASGTGGKPSAYTFSWDNALGTGVAKNVSPAVTTTYRVILTDGCTAGDDGRDTTWVTVFVKAPLILTSRNDTTICKGQQVQLFGYAAGGDNLNYTYTWNNAAGTGSPFVTPLVTTTFRVVLSDNCTTENDTAYVKVTVKDPVEVTASADSTICIGQNRLISANAIGGLNSYTYSWDNGLGSGSSKIVSPELTTTYRVIATDNCTTKPDTAFITINVRPALDMAARNDSTICIGQGIQLSGTANGGDSNNYVYSWDNGPGTGLNKFVSPVVTTTYKIVLTDNCTSISDSDYVTVFVRDPLVLNPRTDSTICVGQSILLHTSGTGGNTAAHSFSWDNGLGNGSQFMVSPVVSTTYRLVLSDNCTSSNDTAWLKITVKAPLKVNPGNDTTICMGQTALLNAIASGGDTSSYNFEWDQGLGSGNFHPVSPTAHTTYRVVLTDNCSISDTAYVTVNVNPALGVLPRTDTTICVGQSLLLFSKASGGNGGNYSYDWDNGLGNGQSMMISPETTTTYMVILTDNCTMRSDTGHVTITVHDPLQAIARTDTIICNGQHAYLYSGASGGDGSAYNYNWDHGLGNGNMIMVQPTVTTTYTVIVTDNCTTLADTGYVTVTVRLPLDIKYAADTTICLGQFVPLFVDGSGGDTLAYTFIWDNGLGSGKNQLVNPAVSTTYNVVLIDNCTFKSDTSSTIVTVRPALDVNAGNDKLICHGETVILNAAGTGGYLPGYELNWDNGLGTGNNFSVTPQQTTTYQVVLSDNCTVNNDTDEVTITVQMPLSVTASPQSFKLCFGEKLQLDANGSGGIPSGYVYTWNNGVGIIKNPLITPPNTAYYIVALSDGCSAPAYDTIDINVEQLPVPDFTATVTTGCDPFDAEFHNNSVSLPGSVMQWYLGDGSKSSSSDPILEHQYNSEGKYTISLRIISPFGCSDSITKAQYITVNPTPVSNFTPNPGVAKITLPKISFINKSSGADSYDWFYGDGASYHSGNIDDQAPHNYADTGFYIVKLISSNQFGCTDEKTEVVRINEAYRFYVPNSFTPNGDGLNDDFTPVMLFTENYELQVYTRWGEIIYFTKAGEPWNGRMQNAGEIVPGGTYLYQYSTFDKDGAIHFTNGIVTVLR